MSKEDSDDNESVGSGEGFNDYSKYKGKSVKSSERSAVKSFNKFLFVLHATKPKKYEHTTLDTLSEEELLNLKKTFGKFPHFLLNTERLKQATTLSKLSQIRKLVSEMCPDSDIMNDKWYRNLRHQTTKCYTAHHKETNTKKSNPAPPMSSEDLNNLCTLLFIRNTTKSIQERALLVLQWQALGRVSETTALSYESLGWNRTYDSMSVLMNRGKVDLEHTIHCFLHSSNWLICPLHALASMIVLASASTHLFSFVPESGAAQHVNSVLRDLETAARQVTHLYQAIKKFTSHSGRSGPATEANEHNETHADWLGPRGGWDLGGYQQMFEYVYGTVKTDGKVGRALSGWKHVDKGGFCPTIECINVGERDEFTLYAANLMSSVTLDMHIKCALVCVLLLHFDDVRAAYPEHDLIRRLIACQNAGLGRVQHWAGQVRADFNSRNGSSLPDETGAVPVQLADIHDLTSAMRDYEGEVSQLKVEMTSIKHELQKAQKDREYLTSLLEQALSRLGAAPSVNTESNAATTSEDRPVGGTITAHFQRRLPPVYVPSSSRFPPSLLISLQNVTLASAFHRWYNEELFKCSVVTEKEIKVRRKLMYAVAMMKRFLPAGSVISAKPSVLQDYQTWSTEIQRLSEVAQEKIMQVCTQAYHEDVTSGERKRQRKLKPMLEGMIKRLGKLYKHKPALFASGAIATDVANPSEESNNLDVEVE